LNEARLKEEGAIRVRAVRRERHRPDGERCPDGVEGVDDGWSPAGLRGRVVTGV
jgi:hypothetical protein